MRDLRAVGLLVVAVLLLSGCSEKQEASSTLPSRTSAAETTESLPTVGPADFPVPDEARTKDAAGAEAFLRYFIDLINHQRAIPAGQPLRDLGPECHDCSRFAKVYDDAAAARRTFGGGELTIVSLTPAFMEGDKATIDFLASQTELSLVDQDGEVLERAPADPRMGSGISLVWDEAVTSWLVTGFTIG